MICHNSVGYDAQIKDLLIKSAFNMDKKEIEKLINSLDQEQKSKLMNALANKSEAERILRTPEAQAIMKKLKGEK